MSGKTWFFGQLGDLLFPFTRPTGPNSSTPGTIDNTTIGSSTPANGTFKALTATSSVNFSGASQTFKDLTVSSNATIGGTLGVTGKATITQLLRGIVTLSTAASASPQGVLQIASTAAKTYTLAAPVIGGDVDIICAGGSTSSRKVKTSSGVSFFGFLSSALGSSKAKTSLNFTGKGQAVRLRALSSVALQVMAKAGAVASS